ESGFDYGTLRWVARDHNIWALMIGVICANPRNKAITRVIQPDHYDSLPGGPTGRGMRLAHRRYQNISYEVCARRLAFEHPIQDMTKAQIIHAMPRDLLDLCWWCRRPRDGKPCHKCYTCKQVDQALKGGLHMLEAKV